MNKCPLCHRELGEINIDQHHLIPKTFKGKDAEKIHKICHQKIHSTFTERELLNYYHTWERLREHPEIEKFIKWVSKRSIDFFDISKDTNERSKKRKR
jgi:5-methylcytosine-specific restriction endonuclease McrA